MIYINLIEYKCEMAAPGEKFPMTQAEVPLFYRLPTI